MNLRRISPQQIAKLNGYTGLSKKVRFKNKNGGGRFVLGTIVDEISIISFDYKHVIQKIELAPSASWDGSRYAYRSGYYTWDASMQYVKWGQYHACLSERECEKLLKLAQRKRWPIF